LPQLLESFDSSTQADPHCASPTAHMGWHVPFVHPSPAPQACPHEPQFFESLAVSVQDPAHEVWVPAHDEAVGGRPHSPLMHA
jgi:hypothetical protein